MDWWLIMLIIIVSIIAGYFGLWFILRYRYSRIKYEKKTRIDGKVVVVTGANTGIGKETAIDLARRGGKVYIACRDVTRGEEALKDIKHSSGSENVHFLQLDLASMESIREFSKKFHELESKLHILINNAGVMMCPQMKTKDGFELQFGTNHLGHFLLTNLLLDLVKAAAPSRIVVVSSEGHRMSGLHKDNLMLEQNYGKIKAYAQSKLANILFANELAKKLEGANVTVNSLHPGVVTTELGRHMPQIFLNICDPFFKPLCKTAVQGAQTQLRCALDPELDNVTGKFFSDCKISGTSRDAQNEESASWLWTESMRLVGLEK